jgi:hypothetical protein
MPSETGGEYGFQFIDYGLGIGGLLGSLGLAGFDVQLSAFTLVRRGPLCRRSFRPCPLAFRSGRSLNRSTVGLLLQALPAGSFTLYVRPDPALPGQFPSGIFACPR